MKMDREKNILIVNLLFVSVLGGLALVSRCRLWENLNIILKLIFGNENQSYFEHLLSGLAGPGIFISMLLLALIYSLSTPAKKPPMKFIRSFLETHRDLLIFIFPLASATIASIAYLLLSFQWETSQVKETHPFQRAHLFMDIAGVVVFMAANYYMYKKWERA